MNITPLLERCSLPSPPFPSPFGCCNTTSEWRWERPSHLMNWHICTIHPWVLATIDKGYRLQFPVKPPVFNGAVISVAQGESACVLKEEKASLLKKRVIRIIPMKERQQGFYSRYSVIPKKGKSLSHCRFTIESSTNKNAFVSKYLSGRLRTGNIWDLHIRMQHTSMGKFPLASL